MSNFWYIVLLAFAGVAMAVLIYLAFWLMDKWGW
jgi:hypothetical protein